MKNFSLNKSDREHLIHFMNRVVTCPEEQTAFDEATKAAAVIVRAVVERKYPPKDMAILEHYRCAQRDKCIIFGNRYNADERFLFSRQEDAPLVPRNGDCSDRTYTWTDEELAACQHYAATKRIWEKAINQKCEIYARLIMGARTAQDILDVWPGAQPVINDLASRRQTRALSVLSAEAIEAIRRDNASQPIAA